MVLIMTLLILVGMLLVSAALLRSTDTSVQAVNNLSFRRAAEASAKIAVEQAVQDILNAQASGSSRPGYFYGSRQANESREGIPEILLSGSGRRFGVGFIQVSDMEVTFIVERMCADPGAGATQANCMLNNNGGMGSVPVNTDGEYIVGTGAGSPVHRVSIRVDGVRSTTVFAQAFIN
jgi:hypothetical protein